MSYYVGGHGVSREHAACVINDHAQVIWRAAIPPTAAGLAEPRTRLARLAPPATLSVALERPSGLLIDTLIAGGFVVVPIHPNALKASRPRYAAARRQSDAVMLADLLRTDGHRFRPLQPPSDETRARRALVRTRDDRVALANQLRALLESFWPGTVQIFADVDSPIAVALLSRYPTAHSAQRLGEKRLAALLAQQHYCGRRGGAELLTRFRQAPTAPCGEAESEAKIEQAVAAHTGGPIVMSVPRAAQMLAELGDDRRRFTSDERLAADAGVAPVTPASGKHRAVTFRRARTRRLRLALTTFADASRHASAWAAHAYQRARARGCDHPHATRILAPAWLRVLGRCWQDPRLYGPAHHRSAQHSTTATAATA